MKRLIWVVFAVVSAGVCHAGGPTNAVTGAKSRSVREVYMRKFGGFVVQPGSLRGRIGFVNAQGLVPAGEIEKVIATIRGEMKYDIALVPTEGVSGVPADGDVKRRGLDVAVYVVDDGGLPSLLAAPDSRWALVNVRKLGDGLPGGALGARLLAVRARGQLMRGFALACGLGTSSYPGNVLGVTGVGELDAVKVDSVVYDMVGRCTAFLGRIGVTPERRVMYSRACAEGWAPAPTNEYQRAIWERARAKPAGAAGPKGGGEAAKLEARKPEE